MEITAHIGEILTVTREIIAVTGETVAGGGEIVAVTGEILAVAGESVATNVQIVADSVEIVAVAVEIVSDGMERVAVPDSPQTAARGATNAWAAKDPRGVVHARASRWMSNAIFVENLADFPPEGFRRERLLEKADVGREDALIGNIAVGVA